MLVLDLALADVGRRRLERRAEVPGEALEVLLALDRPHLVRDLLEERPPGPGVERVRDGLDLAVEQPPRGPVLLVERLEAGHEDLGAVGRGGPALGLGPPVARELVDREREDRPLALLLDGRRHLADEEELEPSETIANSKLWAVRSTGAFGMTRPLVRRAVPLVLPRSRSRMRLSSNSRTAW